LDLPIQGAFFPIWLHGYFESSNYRVNLWHSVVEFQGAEVWDNKVVYVISGGIDILQHVVLTLGGCQRVIVTIEVVWHKASRSALQRAIHDGYTLFEEFGLHPLVIGDAASGGALDAQHLLRFGMDLSPPHIPMDESGLHCSIWHILDGGVEGRFSMVLKSSFSALLCTPRAVL
jgi:hypothetical protein